MSLNIPEKTTGKARYSASGSVILLTGDIDQSDPSEFMEPFFKEVLKQASEAKMPDVTVDIRKLGFVNSSGVKTFVVFMVGLMALPADRRFLVNFQINKEISWQNAVLAPLKVMAPNYVRTVT